MTRLSPRLVGQAKQSSNNLAALLPACRDLQSARNELRWLRDFVRDNTPGGTAKSRHLAELCRRRGRSYPLQYILGTQPFGSLELRCKPGVLIPRSETESYVCHLANLIKARRLLSSSTTRNCENLNVIDLCTGTGCIPLLLYSLLQRNVPRLRVRGFDVAENAVELAKLNIRYNVAQGHIIQGGPEQEISILKGDIFSNEDIDWASLEGCDILLSNPPYVSEKVWNFGLGQLGYSARKYEPRLAIVPSASLSVPIGWQHQDVFYSRLLDVTDLLKPKVALFELGDEPQIRRVIAGFLQHKVARVAEIEVWRDNPDLSPAETEDNMMVVRTSHGDNPVEVKGSGNMRSILLKLNWIRQISGQL